MQSKQAWFELLAWLALGFTAFALTFQFSNELGSYRWGAASWPRVIILLMIIFAIAQFLLHRRISANTDNTTSQQSGSTATKLQLLFTFALPLIYIALLPKAGFYLTTPIFLLLFLLLLGERRWRYLIGVPILIYVLINLIFTKLFYVALPTGTWPGFYDFSNWLITTIR